jgi:hypothetical protein
LDPRDTDPPATEPPPHPSERFDGGRGGGRYRRIARWVPVAFVRFLIFFFVGVAATLTWQSHGNTARRVAARVQGLGWLAPPAAVAAQETPAPGAGTASGTSPEQLAAITRSLAAVRQSVDRLTADVSRLQLQAAKPDPAVRASSTTAPAGRKPPVVQASSSR